MTFGTECRNGCRAFFGYRRLSRNQILSSEKVAALAESVFFCHIHFLPCGRCAACGLAARVKAFGPKEKILARNRTPGANPACFVCNKSLSRRPSFTHRTVYAGTDLFGSCFILSLIETAKQNGIAPEDYLRCLFEKAPYAETREDWEKLLPWKMKLYLNHVVLTAVD